MSSPKAKKNEQREPGKICLSVFPKTVLNTENHEKAGSERKNPWRGARRAGKSVFTGF
jgi:hypothetical protein